MQYTTGCSLGYERRTAQVRPRVEPIHMNTEYECDNPTISKYMSVTRKSLILEDLSKKKEDLQNTQKTTN